MLGPTQLFRVAQGAIRKRQGDLGGRSFAELPSLSLHRKSVTIDAPRLQRYLKVCRLSPQREGLPPAFLETLFPGLIAELTTHRDFPVSPLGLTHVRQAIAQPHPIVVDGTVDLQCTVSGVRQTERGVELDFHMTVEQWAERVWFGKTTLLSRGSPARYGTKLLAQRRANAPAEGDVRTFEIEETTGLDYLAAVGEDVTSLLHPWPHLYKRSTAPRMWALATMLGTFEMDQAFSFPLRIEADLEHSPPSGRPATLIHGWQDDRARFELRDDAGQTYIRGVLEQGLPFPEPAI